MNVQTDYETELTLAVFASPVQAGAVVGELRAVGVPDEGIQLTMLGPGSYQCIDPFLGEQVTGVLRGAGIGALIGAVLAVAIAMSVGGTWDVVAWLAVVGLGAGALVGSIIGAEVRAHYDDDIARQIYISPDQAALVVQAETPNLVTRRARTVLRRARPVGFLDPALYAAA